MLGAIGVLGALAVVGTGGGSATATRRRRSRRGQGEGRVRSQGQGASSTRPATVAAATSCRSRTTRTRGDRPAHVLARRARRTCRRATSRSRPARASSRASAARSSSGTRSTCRPVEVGENPVEVGKQGWDRKGSLKRKGDSFVAEQKGEKFQRKVTAEPARSSTSSAPCTLRCRARSKSSRASSAPRTHRATAGPAPLTPRPARRCGGGRAGTRVAGAPAPRRLKLSRRLKPRRRFKRELHDPGGAHRRADRDRDAPGEGRRAARREDEDVDLRRHVPRPDDPPPGRRADRGHLRPQAAGEGRRADGPPARWPQPLRRGRPARRADEEPAAGAVLPHLGPARPRRLRQRPADRARRQAHLRL